MASRFVTTYECDADLRYKEAYLKAGKEDVILVKSPVGMPGRAIENQFIKDTRKAREAVVRCNHCLKQCDPATTPYCITAALIRAVKGDVEHSLVFCGENAYRLDRIVTVKELMEELTAKG